MILRLCIGRCIVFHGPAVGIRCLDNSVYVDTGTYEEWFYRSSVDSVSIDWLSQPFLYITPEARESARYLLRTATITPVSPAYAEQARVAQRLLPALANSLSDDTIDIVIREVYHGIRS